MYSGAEPTTSALARRERRLRLVRLSEVVAAAGAITTAVAAISMFDSFGPGALVATVVGLAVLVAGALAAQRLRRTVRYRVGRPNSTAWLAGKIALLLAVMVGAIVIASAVDAPSLPRTVIVLVVVGALAGVVNTHAARWTLFQVDATGLKVGQAGVPWPAVAQLDVALAGPGLAEIGVGLVAGHGVNGTPTPGMVLTDLPVCTMVPASAVHVDRIGWAVREFGNPAIPVVARAQGPGAPPMVAMQADPPAALAAEPPAVTPQPVATEPPPPMATPAPLAAGPPAEMPAGPPQPMATPAPLPAGPPAEMPAGPSVAPPQPMATPAPMFAPMPPHAGPPYPHPAGPGRRRGWVIGAALGLAAVLIAGVVTTVVLVSGDDDPKQPGTSAESERQSKYSAAKAGEPCELIDVYVLKAWSTVKEIVTEPSRHELADYDSLNCGAHSNSEYVEGRVTNLDLTIAVAESPEAARAFHTEQIERDYWNATGDVREQGKLPGLGESADFDQAVSNYADHTRTEYVLRVIDDNLVLFLRFGSDADQSDGQGVSVGELADTARAQAKGAMDKLRSRPAKKDKADAEPAKVPKTINDAVTLPGTAELMDRIRGADPCELHDRTEISAFGTVAVEPHQALGLAECRLMATTAPTSPRTVFGIDLDVYLAEEERADLTRAELDGMEVFHSQPDPGSNSCTYYIPHGNSGFGAEVKVIRYVEGLEEQGPWAEACEVADKYTSKVAGKIADLPARSAPAPEPTVIGKDPCMAEEVVSEVMPGWRLSPVARYYSAQCRFFLTQGDESYEFEMDFDRDAEQDGDGPVTIGGLTGQWFNQYEGQCGVSLVYVPESAPEAWDAQNIGVSIMQKGNYGTPGSQDLCALTQSIAQMLVDKVG